jgi:hypothetical protein
MFRMLCEISAEGQLPGLEVRKETLIMISSELDQTKHRRYASLISWN